MLFYLYNLAGDRGESFGGIGEALRGTSSIPRGLGRVERALDFDSKGLG